jgi:hypothetical protein
MKRATRIRRGGLWLGTLALLASLLGLPFDLPGVGERDAQAIRGRPLTPMSYAGVARRTSRRTVRRTAYAAPYAAAPAPYYAAPPAPYYAAPPAPYW